MPQGRQATGATLRATKAPTPRAIWCYNPKLVGSAPAAPAGRLFPETMALPRPPQQLRAKRTRRELLAAARQVVAHQGYEGATIEDIAHAAGCTKGAYYFHFASKEETLVALLDAWIAERSHRLAQAVDVQPDALLAALTKALAWQDAGWEAELLVEFWSQGQRNGRVGERLSEAYRSWQATLALALAEAGAYDGSLAPLSPQASACAMLALADGLVLQSCLRVAPARSAAAQQALAAFALLARPGSLRRAG
jgi:AcrR family transcriptional regulator